MSQINHVNNGALPTRLDRFSTSVAPSVRHAPATTSEERRVEGDTLDLSAEVLRLDAGAEDRPIRADLVAKVRDEIASGTYETAERINRAVDSLANELLD